MPIGEVIRIAARSVARAKRYTPNVEFSAMDATRSDVEFLLAVIEAAIREGATTINIPDTVGDAIPLSLEASFVRSGNESRE
jgi:2-isopropylmalate synthase